MVRFCFLFFIFLVVSSFGFSQTSLEEEMKISIKNESNSRKKISRQLALGEYYLNHNIQKADSVQRVLEGSVAKQSDSVKVSHLLFKIELSNIKGNQRQYFRLIEELTSLSKDIKNERALVEINLLRGIYYSIREDFKLSQKYFYTAKSLSKDLRNNNLSSKVNRELALDKMRSNDKDSALYFVDESLKYARRASNRSTLAMAFGTQAKIFDYFGQTELSVAKYLLGLRLSTENNNMPLMSLFSREVGKLQVLISNYNDAEFYFLKALEYAIEIKDSRQIALSLTSLGNIYNQRREFKKAQDYHLKAINYLNSLNDDNGLGEANNNLGTIYRELKNYDKALAYFNKSLVLYESTGNKERIAGVYNNVGTVFIKQKKFDNALIYLNRSVDIRNQISNKTQIFPTYKLISEVYSNLGNNEKAYSYMQKYVAYQDSTASVQASTKIAELSELYRSEQREELISIQADSIERQLKDYDLTNTKLENIQLRNNSQRYIIIGFVLLAIIAGIMLFYRYNQNKIKTLQREAEMSQTLLRSQMNPHFIFNSMSVIQSYIFENDTKKSSKFLVNFSKLMRLILENSSKEFIPLETEIDILNKYLETQKLRFENRFEYSIHTDKNLLDANVVIPPMITQPFIENAIEHGQLHLVQHGFIEVKFHKKDNYLVVTITDNGVGREVAEQNKKSKEHKSLAMNITRERIDSLNTKYKSNCDLQIEDFNKELKIGTKVLISLPFRVEIIN